MINRYREATIALGYSGDSVINSVFDVLFMLLGFVFAWRLPVWRRWRSALVAGDRRARLDDPRQPDAERADAALSPGQHPRLAIWRLTPRDDQADAWR